MPLTPAYDTTKQVPDDPELIALMMTELDKAGELYKPTNSQFSRNGFSELYCPKFAA